MDQLDSHRALTHGRRHSLDGPMPHVAGDEDARQARLKEERIAIKRPAIGARAGRGAWQIWASQDETLRVARQDTRNPLGARLRANEDEEG